MNRLSTLEEMADCDPMPPSADAKIVKTELFDADAMVGLSNHEGVSSEVKRLLKAYRKLRTNGNNVQVVYEYGKHLKILKKGRLYPTKGLGLQAFPSDVRSALAQKYYWDIDMVNCQPVLLVQLCDKMGWMCDSLRDYVINRSEKLHELMVYFDCDRDRAKEVCLSILFGGKFKKIPDFYKNMSAELDRIAKNAMGVFPDIAKVCAKQPNPSASCLAHVIQSLEAEILQYIDTCLKTCDRNMATYIHDGGLVEKLVDETEFPPHLLRWLEAQIVKKFNLRITLAQKPMAHSFIFNYSVMRMGFVSEDQYQTRKEEFEKDHFYCQETNTVCWVQDDGAIMHTNFASAGVSFASYNFQKVVDGELATACFSTEWLKDPTKKTVKQFVFCPDPNPMKQIPNTYNTYKGFVGSVKPEGDMPEKQAIIDRFKDLIFHNAGKLDVMNTYMTNWLALLVQKPWVVPGVAIILINRDQGTGKETLGEFMGSKVIGREYYKNIKNLETELFDSHSTAMDKTLFLKFEEVNGSLNRKFSDMLKAIITTTTATINPKGVKKYVIDAYPHIFMTTNNPVPVKVEGSDRRMCISHTSSDLRGNREYWNKTYSLLDLPYAGYVVYEYLKNIDLAEFDVREFPRTEYHQILSSTERTSEDLFLNEECKQFEDMSATALHSRYIEYCNDNHLVPKSITHFSRAMAPMIDRKIITRRLKDGKNLYTKA